MKLISRKDTAAFLSVSIPTLKRGVASGLFPAPLKTGKRKLAWDQEALEAALKNQVGGNSRA